MGHRYWIAQKMSSEAMNLRAWSSGSHGAPEWASPGPSFLPQRPIEHFDPIVLAGRPEARDERAGTGTIKRVATVAAFGEQLPATAAEALDALDDRIVGHGVDDRTLGRRTSPTDACGIGATRILRLGWHRIVCAPLRRPIRI